MKITKAQLKQIIMEELSSLSEKRVEEDPKAALEDIYFESENCFRHDVPRQKSLTLYSGDAGL